MKKIFNELNEGLVWSVDSVEKMSQWMVDIGGFGLLSKIQAILVTFLILPVGLATVTILSILWLCYLPVTIIRVIVSKKED